MGGTASSAALPSARDAREASAAPDSGPAHAAPHAREPDPLALAHGHTLTIAARPGGQVLELRAPGGTMELRVHLREDGPVLCAESMRLLLAATEDIEMRCQRFRLEARESLSLASRGSARVQAAETISVRAADYLELHGKLLGLNSDRATVLENMARLYFDGDMARCRAWLAEQDSPVLDW